jgi:hypothetical protein
MKIGDLVRSVNNKTHQKFGYGFVVELSIDHVRPNAKVLWLRYRGEMNPRWMYKGVLEKVE